MDFMTHHYKINLVSTEQISMRLLIQIIKTSKKILVIIFQYKILSYKINI